MSDPLTRLVELTVYAPIGVAAVVRERLPEYVEEGRSRVEQRLTLARFIGQMVVTQGRREVERRVREAADRSDAGPDSSAPPAPVTVEPDAADPVVDETVTGGAMTGRAAPDAAAADVESDRSAEADPAPSSESLPIEGYESLAAAQVVARLRDLDDAGLAEIERFERVHRNRRTVLNRIDQLRAS